jgi:hypothetical protein
MKVLKRPMFRYGGGVKKQGIMHGMKGMQDGGPATMADATGYANGGMTMFPPMRGRVTRPGGYAGKQPNYMGNNINNMGGSSIENFYKNNQANVTGDYSKINQPPEILTRDERIQKQKDVYKPSYTIQDLYEKNMNVTDEQIPQETRYGVVMVDNPNYGRVKRVDKAIADADAEGPVGIEGKDLTGKNLTGEITAEGPVGIEGKDLTGKNLTGLPKVTSNKEKDADRLKRVYDIMGVDDARKDAAYNALIDLSQGQAIDTKDISGSINRAIGALSKRADKVDDLKDKGKAALASGTIQEMFRDDRSEASKRARELVDSGAYKTYAEAYKKVLKLDDDTLGKRILTNAKTQAGLKVNDKSILDTLAAEKDFREDLGGKKEVAESIEKGTFTDVIDIVTKKINVEPGDKSKDGLYKVGLTVIRVTNGSPAIVFNR